MKLNESNKSKVLSMVKTAVFFALVFTLVITSFWQSVICLEC